MRTDHLLLPSTPQAMDLTLLFGATAYFIRTIPYDPYEYGAAVVVALFLPVVGQYRELPGYIQR